MIGKDRKRNLQNMIDVFTRLRKVFEFPVEDSLPGHSVALYIYEELEDMLPRHTDVPYIDDYGNLVVHDNLLDAYCAITRTWSNRTMRISNVSSYLEHLMDLDVQDLINRTSDQKAKTVLRCLYLVNKALAPPGHFIAPYGYSLDQWIKDYHGIDLTESEKHRNCTRRRQFDWLDKIVSDLEQVKREAC
jgi:hypothetical protein